MSNSKHLTAISQAIATSLKKQNHLNSFHREQANIVGIGIGPSNLSLAALLQPVSQLSSVFFDKQEKFVWHSGMLLPDAKLQVSYLKDLVTLVDPTNPFSFLNFLSHHKRLYQFITANFPRVSRQEFNQYYQWVCNSLPNLRFGSTVKSINIKNNLFNICIEKTNITQKINTQTIVMGIGLQPRLPECAHPYLGESIFHASQFMQHQASTKGKTVVVVGGGQSGAEIVQHYLSSQPLCQKLIWLSRRDNFLPLDESPFINDLFTPHYSNYFYSLPVSKKQALLAKQQLFSDGISPSTLEAIYRRLYELTFVEKKPNLCKLRPNSEVIDIIQRGKKYCLSVRNLENGETTLIETDVIIYCTGYKYVFPEFLYPLSPYIHFDNQKNLCVNDDFSIQWDGPQHCKLYLQNGALLHRGVADPNLSLMPWRSAVIINSITKQNIYSTQNQESFIDWFSNLPKEYKGENHEHRRVA